MKSDFLHQLALGVAAASLLAAEPARAQKPNGATRLSMDQAINLALSRDADVERARRSLEQSKIQVANAKSGYLPNASVTIGINQSARGSISRGEDFTFRQGIAGNFVGTLNANISMPIDISGSIGRRVQSARLGEESSEIMNQRVQRDTLIEVQISYLQALQAQQKVRIDESIVQSLEALKERARSRYASLLPFFDVELANAREALEQGRATAEQMEDSLKLSLQLPFALDLELADDVPDPKALPRIADGEIDIDENLEVRSAGKQLETARLAIEQARDFNRPGLRLGASASQTFSGHFVDDAGETSSRNYGFNISFNLPILNFDAGRTDNSVKSSELRAEQSEADLRQAKLAAEMNVRQARMALARAEKRLERLPDPGAASQALGNAIRALLRASPESAPGILAQVTNARMTWRFAQYAAIDAKTDAAIAILRLSKAIGEPVRLANSTS